MISAPLTGLLFEKLIKRFVRNVAAIAAGRDTKRGIIAPSPKNIPAFIRHISTRKPNTPAKQKPIIMRNVTPESPFLVVKRM